MLAKSQHVHLTELENGRVVNPLARGRIGPYSDTTTPHVASITFRRSDESPELLPNFLRGRIEVLVSAYDLPTLPAPGIWKNLPTTPAMLTWRIQDLRGNVVVRKHVAYDHREAWAHGSLTLRAHAVGDGPRRRCPRREPRHR